MEIMLQEIDARMPESFEKMTDEMQADLRDQKCCHCGNSFEVCTGRNSKIMYVVLEDGRVRFWCWKYPAPTRRVQLEKMLEELKEPPEMVK